MDLSITTICISIWLFVSINADEYGSFHNSTPPFHYYRSRFSCIHQNKKMLWDSLTVEVHPGMAHGCGISLLNSEIPDLWTSIDSCLNEDNVEGDGCSFDGDMNTAVYRFNQTQLLSNNITFPCAANNERPEIVAIHLLYTCSGHHIHEEYEGGDIGTPSPPPPPPRPVPTMIVEPTELPPPPPPPPGYVPSMIIEPTNQPIATTTHNIVTHGHVETTTPPEDRPGAYTTESRRNHYNGIGPRKGNIDGYQPGTENPVNSHPITATQLATIVGPSVAAVSLLLIILIIVIVIIKRKTLKLPRDLQGESLFHSRRFSTASQLSDISLNNHQMRSVP